jgi:hypothetical protein
MKVQTCVRTGLETGALKNNLYVNQNIYKRNIFTVSTIKPYFSEFKVRQSFRCKDILG